MKIRGFTLIELMIVVTLIAIIAAIAIPSYQKYVEKTRRADAQSALLQAAQAMERCFTRTNTYAHADCQLPTYGGGRTSPDGFYTLSFVARDATSFRMQALPQGAQANDPCKTFTLDQRGNKSNTGADSDPPANLRCWGS